MVAFLLGLPLWLMAAVAVALPPGAGDDAAARVLANCQAALGAGQCVLASDAGDAEWRADVRWDGLRLRVTLARAAAPAIEVARREAVFSARDSEAQRWVATGLIVAALTAAQSKAQSQTQPAPAPAPATAQAAAAQAAPEPEPEPKPEPESEPVPVPVPEPAEAVRGTGPPVRTRVDVGGLVGSGLRASDPRLGALARGTLLWRAPRLGPTASLRFAGVFTDPQLRWYGASAGVGARLTGWSAPLGVELLGELVLEQARASAVRDGMEQAATSSLRVGGRVGVVASYRLARWFSPWLGAELATLRPRLEVRVAGQRAGTEGALRWGLSLGVRWELGGRE